MSSAAASSFDRPATRAVDRGRFALVGLATVVAAVFANVVVYVVGRAVVGYDPAFIVLSDVSPTILFTVVPAVVAAPIYAALLRFVANPARVFTILAAVVFVVTVIPDFTYIPSVPGASAGQVAVLVLMHLVAAVVIVRMLTTLARPRAR